MGLVIYGGDLPTHFSTRVVWALKKPDKPALKYGMGEINFLD